MSDTVSQSDFAWGLGWLALFIIAVAVGVVIGVTCRLGEIEDDIIQLEERVCRDYVTADGYRECVEGFE